MSTPLCQLFFVNISYFQACVSHISRFGTVRRLIKWLNITQDVTLVQCQGGILIAQIFSGY